MDSIKTHVEIRSDHFPLTEKELEKWDGQISGELLAQYLSTKLTEYELPIAGFDDEDWGFIFHSIRINIKIYSLAVIVMKKTITYS